MPIYVISCIEDLLEDLPIISSGAPLNTPVHTTNFTSPQSDKLFLNYIKSFKYLVCLQCVTITVISRKITIDGSLYSLSYSYVSIPL